MFTNPRLLACLLLSLASPLTAQAAEFRVGASGDASCTHTTLLAALLAAAGNGPGMDTIKIATNQTYTGVALPISGHSLRLEGGYASCGVGTASGRTSLTGSAGASSAISTSGSGAHALELVNLEIANSPTGGSASRLGGGLRVAGDYRVTLRNTRIRNNRAARGGGIHVAGVAGTRLVLEAPLNAIEANTASISGGGVYCTGAAQIELRAGAAAITGNSAEAGGTDPDESGTGGGVALFNGCTLVQVGGSASTGVYDNIAVQYGGGYYLRNQAELRLEGTGQGPARVIDNRVSLNTGATPGAGGGIAIRDPAGSGTSSEVLALNAWIDHNYAWQGAGVALLGGGRFLMGRTLAGVACHDARYCSSLSFNGQDGSTLAARAGALWAQQDAVVTIASTYVEGNGASVGSAFWTNDSARVTLDSLVLTGNFGATTLIDARNIGDGGEMVLAWSTVTGNTFTGAAFGRRILDATAVQGANPVKIYGSLLGEPIPVGTSAPSLRSDCVLRDPAMQFPAGNVTRQATLASPYGLAGIGAGTFHLAGGNVVPVDWCDASLAPRFAGDIAGAMTTVDAIRGNLHGIHDIGAHEYQDSDLIFANGFQ